MALVQIPALVGANFTLLNTGGTALTGSSTITVSGISNQEELLILIASASSANASSEINIRFNTDSTNKYGYAGTTLGATTTYSSANFTGTQNTAATEYPLAQMSTNAGSLVQGTLRIVGCKSTGIKAITSLGGASGASGDNNRYYHTQGFYSGTSAITSVSIISSTGNFDNGTIFIYGSSN